MIPQVYSIQTADLFQTSARGNFFCLLICTIQLQFQFHPNFSMVHASFTRTGIFLCLFFRWSVIASQLPGRTDNEIKNLWNTKLRKLLVLKGINPITHQPLCNPMLSDYVKQWVKSIEDAIITGLMAQSSSNNINSNSLHPTLPSFMSLPLDSSLNEEGLGQSHPLKASPNQNALTDNSWVDDGSSRLNDNLDGDLMMGEEASLQDNMDEYLRDGFGTVPSTPFFDGYMDSMMSTANLEEGLLATKA